MPNGELRGALEASGALLGGGGAKRELKNAPPPSNGIFSACLREAADSTCVSTGLAIVDSFVLMCNGWTDTDLPLHFVFGFSLVSNSVETPSPDYWWEPTLDFSRDALFPAGSVITRVQVVDLLGAGSDVLTSTLTIISSGSQLGGQRRLHATSSLFYSEGIEIMSKALRSSRADQVNQLAGAIAIEGANVLSAGEATSLRSELMSALVSGTTMAVNTLSFACEVFGAAVLVLNATNQLDDKSIVESGILLKRLALDVTQRRSLDPLCADSVATMIACGMQAQSSLSDRRWANSSLVPELDNRSVHILDEEQGIAYMQNIEYGSTELMTKLIWNAMAGGPVRTAIANASRHTMARAKIADLVNRTFTQSSPLYDSNLQPATVMLSATLALDLASVAEQEVDVHVQSHSHAPAGKGLWIRSQLFGTTLSLARGGHVLTISNLSSPIKLYLPVHTYRMSAREQMLFPQQARCVFWANDKYETKGCKVTAVDGHVPSEASWPRKLPLSLVTAESTHLTMFAINQDYRAPACGDSIIQSIGGGIVQENEECDDEDIDSGDGCSSSCTVETNYSCFSVPSVCVAHPSTFGIQAVVKLWNFYSLHDFTKFIDEFAQAISTSIGLGVQSIDISTFKLCYRSACTTYFDVHADPEQMRRLVAGENSNAITVYFQVNAQKSESLVYLDILGKLRTYEYMPAFVSQFVVLSGRRDLYYEWLQPPVLVDPKYAPGWKDPQPVPSAPAPKADEGIYKPTTELDKTMDWFHHMAGLFGISLGSFIFIFISMTVTIIGAFCVLRAYYRKKLNEPASSNKIAPSPLPPGSPRQLPQAPEVAPVVFLQDGVESMPADAILQAGWGASSILNHESIAEVVEDSEKNSPHKPAPPPPLPPGKMKRPQISTLEIIRLRQNAEKVSQELETLIASIDDGPRSAISSRESGTSITTADICNDRELLQAMEFVPPPSEGRMELFSPVEPAHSLEHTEDARRADEISSTPSELSPKRTMPEATQSKISRLKRELDRLMAQDEYEADSFNAAEANRSALFTGHDVQSPARDDEIEDDDRQLFSGTRNYSSLRGRFPATEEWERSKGPDAKSFDFDFDAPYTFRQAKIETDQILDSAERKQHPSTQSPDFLASPILGPFQMDDPSLQNQPRTPFRRQSPVRVSPDPDDSPDPWSPAQRANDIFFTPTANQIVTSMDKRNSHFDFLSRRQRNVNLMGSLRPATVGTTQDAIQLHQHLPLGVTTAWADDNDEQEAGSPFISRRTVVAVTPSDRNASGRKTQDSIAESVDFSSPRSPSRLLDDKLIDEDFSI